MCGLEARSGKQFVANAGIGDGDVGESVGAAVVGEVEAGVVEAEAVKQRGVEVVDGDDVGDGACAEVVGGTVDVA